MKIQRFHVPGSLLVERHRQIDGPVFVAWKPNTSMLFADRKALLKFCAWPPSTPTGQELRAWLDSFEETIEPEPQVDFDRLKAEGFGPEQHEPMVL